MGPYKPLCFSEGQQTTAALVHLISEARTLRNDNSSRFGKFIELQFLGHLKKLKKLRTNGLFWSFRVVIPRSSSLGFPIIFHKAILGGGISVFPYTSRKITYSLYRWGFLIFLAPEMFGEGKKRCFEVSCRYTVQRMEGGSFFLTWWLTRGHTVFIDFRRKREANDAFSL